MKLPADWEDAARRERDDLQAAEEHAAALVAVAARLWHLGDGQGGHIEHLLRTHFATQGLEVFALGKLFPSAVRGTISPRLRAIVLELCNYACLWCGATADLTVDHVLPVSKGGETAPDNLQVLCRPCNSSKGARL